MSLYLKKYRIETTRLSGWNYSNGGLYFVTLCVKNRQCSLGKILDGQMTVSEIGTIAENFWQEIPSHFPQVQLDVYVVMPNHVHGIIAITKPVNGTRPETRHVASLIWNDHVKGWAGGGTLGGYMMGLLQG